MINSSKNFPKAQNKKLTESGYGFFKKKQNSQQIEIVQLNRIMEDQQKRKCGFNQRIINCFIQRSPILRTQVKDIFTDFGVETFGSFKHNSKSIKRPKTGLFYKKNTLPQENAKCQKLKKFIQERFAQESSLKKTEHKYLGAFAFLYQLLNNGQHLVSKRNYIALDCEMVGGLKETPNLLAKVSIVDYYGEILLDSFVEPEGEVKDYRTRITGITEKTLVNAPAFKNVQREVLETIKNKTIIGHNIDIDLKALGIKDIIKNKTFDTLEIPVYCKTKNATLSLQGIIYNLFGLPIQKRVHSSIIDSMATMAAFRFVEPMWFNNKALEDLAEILNGNKNN